MNREEALAIVKPHLTEHRYEHTLGVVKTAKELAKRFGADENKAELASIFHDYAKFRSKTEMKQILLDKQISLDMLEYGDELLHAPCGAYLVKTEVGIEDEEVLTAIQFHTTGRPGMTLLEKVVFLADYIEPNRKFPGVEEARELAKTSLDEAMILALRNTMTFLLKKSHAIYPGTLATYNELLQNK
ncbi:bis(5'-nucleosyl)-tetraphosphatase (symmetrical) YqeK [Bacillus alkalicellulosilyticus]|uniref:bis(5'-nucleosyl)-tetraphosphatase (symmetrical) YqeK n=1 Tax=Alkalihalobacterium alkalicellulosilyticum TaxID=1912214 RepID=UPI000998332A|nr:bis(5'-nucleosyl)-tetraphosphatase (symmetrical) YqeK [Bacillus alkalicellulosilyticus]